MILSNYSKYKINKMTSVVRIRRYKGEIVQDCDVYIGRNMFMGGWQLRQSIWVLMIPIYIYFIISAVMGLSWAVRICRRAPTWRSAIIVIKYRILTGV